MKFVMKMEKVYKKIFVSGETKGKNTGKIPCLEQVIFGVKKNKQCDQNMHKLASLILVRNRQRQLNLKTWVWSQIYILINCNAVMPGEMSLKICSTRTYNHPELKCFGNNELVFTNICFPEILLLTLV